MSNVVSVVVSAIEYRVPSECYTRCGCRMVSVVDLVIVVCVVSLMGVRGELNVVRVMMQCRRK